MSTKSGKLEGYAVSESGKKMKLKPQSYEVCPEIILQSDQSYSVDARRA